MTIGLLTGCLALLMGSLAVAEDNLLTLFDFTEPEAAKQWQAVNDGVMGGVSSGRFCLTEEGSMEFFGTLSLANNGGFASVRTKAKRLGLEKGDIVIAKIRGDGREYSLNLYLDRAQIAYSYRTAIQTRKDEWLEIQVPLDKFQATSFGRVVRNAGAVKPDEVNSIGFMLSDKTAGSFQLEVEWIKVQRAGR